MERAFSFLLFSARCQMPQQALHHQYTAKDTANRITLRQARYHYSIMAMLYAVCFVLDNLSAETNRIQPNSTCKTAPGV